MKDIFTQDNIAKRLVFLKYLYKKVGDDELASIPYLELVHDLGFSASETANIRTYLLHEGLISYPFHGAISITHRGIKEMENNLSEPDNPTNPLPTINMIHVEHMENSQIQQGHFRMDNIFFSTTTPQKRLSDLISDLENINIAGFPDDPYQGFNDWVARATPIIKFDWPTYFDNFVEIVDYNEWTNKGFAEFASASMGTPIDQQAWNKDKIEIIKLQQKIKHFLSGLLSLPPKQSDQSQPNSSPITIAIGNHSNVGDIVFSHSIIDSFNRTSQAEISEDLKNNLKNLAFAVSKITSKMDIETAQKVEADLETLTKEATSQNPRQK